MRFDYQKTTYACFIGYIVQAIVNSFVPLLFVTFQKSYHIPLTQITLLITVNFMIQLLVDLLSAGFIDKIGYRASVIIAHICAALGLLLLTILPEIMQNPFTGILIAVFVYAIGGGLIEVLISPIIEACPTDNKEAAMSLLHSFYCWGCTGVVLISTVFFALIGIDHWKILTLFWTIIPIGNMILFTKVPIYSLTDEDEKGMNLNELFREKIFSILMGLSRLIYGKYGDKLDLDRFMKLSCVLCIASYLCISLVPIPIVELIGCGICGFSVGIMWPGTFSKASAALRRGGTLLFAMLALAGDLGCSGGPTLVGFVSSAAGTMRMGILAGIIAPVFLLVGIYALCRRKRCTHKE